MENVLIEGKDVAEPDPIGSGAMYSNRIIPRDAVTGIDGNVAGEPTVIVHEPVEVRTPHQRKVRTRCNPLVYEAMALLRDYDFLPVRLSEPAIPVNLIGIHKSSSLLIHVVRSRKPVPDAATLRRLYPENVEYLCGLADKVQYRIMIWVYSPQCGWRYYLVYPGGLRKDLDFPKSLKP